MKAQPLRLTLGLALALPVMLPASASKVELPPGASVAPQAAEEIFYVDWNITAHGEVDATNAGIRTVSRRAVQIAGSAVARKPPEGFVNTIPFQLTVTDDWYKVETSSCSEDHNWWTITDPGRYNGGPDEFWVYPTTFWPQQREDGSWYMDNPFSDLAFSINGQLYRDFSYRLDNKHVDLCGDNGSSGTFTWQLGHYAGILFPLRTMPLEGDPTGTTFSLSQSYVIEYADPPLTVNFNATVRVGSCKDLAGPIDISSPLIRSLELNLETTDTEPDSTSFLLAKVTCQGVPVKNASVDITMRAKPRSGGHEHDDGQRPRGYIEGYEVTQESSRVTKITDNDGDAIFVLGPGRDLANKTRGIAGWYIVEARVVNDASRPAPEEQTGFHASLPLLPLPDNPGYVLNYLSWSTHADSFWGTAHLVQLMQQAATTWKTWQEEHNQKLLDQGKPAWPLVRLDIIAASLPLGGLFDSQFGAAWRPPFSYHRTGTEVQLLPAIGTLSFPGVDQAEAYAWLWRQFRRLGRLYGTWFYDGGTPYNLRVSAGLAADQMAESLAGPEQTATTPDVAAVVALASPAGHFVAGAGETVTYTVGVENLAAGTTASDVVLSAALPTGLNFISANPPPTGMADARTPVWAIGSLPDEAVPRVFDVVAQVDPSVAPGTVLTVSATAMTSSLDADPANDQFDAWGLTVQVPGPDLVIGSDLDAAALTVGEPVTFTVELANAGNTPAPGSWLQLTLPPSVTITSAVPPTSTTVANGVRWDASALAPGAAPTFTVGLHVDPGLLDLSALVTDADPQYPLAFELTAGSAVADIDPASNQLPVNKRAVLPGADLLVGLHAEDTPGPGRFAVGQIVTYTLRYGNFGNRTAATTTATMRLWDGLAPLAMTPAPSQADTDASTGVTTLNWNLGDLAVGDTDTIQVRVRVDAVPADGSLLLASLSSNSRDLNPADNAVMEVRTVAPAGGGMLFLPMIVR